MKVALCVPHAEKVIPVWYRHVFEMQAKFPQHQFTYVEVDTLIVGKARNMCVEAATNVGAEIIWFIDDDVLIPPDAGVLVDQAASLGVVSGLYFSRRQPHTPAVFELADGVPDNMYWPVAVIPDHGIEKRAAVGAGCLAIDAGVFKKLDSLRTLFCEQSEKLTMPSLARIVRQLSPWFEFLDRRGEDLYFCEQCQVIGQDIWVNFDIQCKHIGQVLIEKGHWKYLVDNGLLKREPITNDADVREIIT